MIDVPGIRSAQDASTANPANAQAGYNGQQGSSAATRSVTTTADSWQQNTADTMPQAGADAERRLIRREQPGTDVKDAEFNQLARAPGRADPSQPVAPDARRDVSAAYIDIWRREVERVGSANFPWDALVMGRSNSLMLAVAIRSDGSVAQARIERSSGLPMLDKAALNILAMAAPFPAFPEPLRRISSEIRFSYVWEFLPGGNSSSGALHVGGE
jgi:protein TonB